MGATMPPYRHTTCMTQTPRALQGKNKTRPKVLSCGSGHKWACRSCQPTFLGLGVGRLHEKHPLSVYVKDSLNTLYLIGTYLQPRTVTKRNAKLGQTMSLSLATTIDEDGPCSCPPQLPWTAIVRIDLKMYGMIPLLQNSLYRPIEKSLPKSLAYGCATCLEVTNRKKCLFVNIQL